MGADIRQAFEATGVVRLEAAFTSDEASAMREAVWNHAERKGGLRRDDPSTWPQGWAGFNWKGLRRSSVFDPLTNNSAIRTAFDAIFGVAGWQHPAPGAQILFTLPRPGPWALPDSWHMDCGFERPTWPTFAVKAFAFFDDVGPRGGGTMVLSGTHRLVDRYRELLPPNTGGGKENWRRFLKSDRWLSQLLYGAKRPDLGRSLVGESHEIEGVPVQVMELTGRPGDIVLTHLHIFHAVSPNTTPQPRQMLGKEIRASSPGNGNDVPPSWPT